MIYRRVGERYVKAGIVLWVHAGVDMSWAVEAKPAKVLEGQDGEES